MIDLHTHTILSDGELLPEELISRCESKGYRRLAITDHAGFSNVEPVLAALRKTCEAYRGVSPITVIPGVEITHVHPRLIGKLVALARDAGAAIVIGHGETLVEPVPPGTNRAMIEAGVDVLAHPGLITDEDAALAAERRVLLEISARKGHSLTNGHVAATARKAGAALSFGTDAHDPDDLCTREEASRILRGSGLSAAEAEKVFAHAERFFT
jgi:histidinol phosphatase-like PHP family hydrolase